MSNSLQGRIAVVFGVANKRSIAWAIAQQMQAAGAQLAITYQNERLKQEADELIAAKGVKHGKLTITSTGKDLPA